MGRESFLSQHEDWMWASLVTTHFNQGHPAPLHPHPSQPRPHPGPDAVPCRTLLITLGHPCHPTFRYLSHHRQHGALEPALSDAGGSWGHVL
jgi:hypothetical protein